MKTKKRNMAVALALLAAISTPAYAKAMNFKPSFSLPALTRIFNEEQFSIEGINLEKNGDLLYLRPLSASTGQPAIFRYSWSTSGEGTLKKGSMRFSIPKHAMKNSDGVYSDALETSFITKKRADELGDNLPANTKFVISGEDEDHIYVENYVEITSGSSGYFEFSYKNMEPIYRYDNHEKFPIEVVAEINGDVVKRSVDFCYDEEAHLDSVNIWQPDILYSYPKGWGEAPDDADDYNYIEYAFTNKISPYPTTTSVYDLTLNGDVNITDENGSPVKAEIVGYQNVGKVLDGDVDKGIHYGGEQYGKALIRVKKGDWDKAEKMSIAFSLTDELTAAGIGASKASSKKMFSWTKPKFDGVKGEAYARKAGNLEDRFVLGDYARYDLDELQEGVVDSLGGIRYILDGRILSYPWTLKDGSDPNRPENYGANPVRFVQRDDKVSLKGKKKIVLSPEDYAIEKIRIKPTFYDVTKKGGVPVINKDTQEFDVNQIFPDWEVKVRLFTSGGETRELVVKNGTCEGKKLDDGWLILPTSDVNKKNNVVGYEVEYENSYYKNAFDFSPVMRIFGTKNVLDAIEDEDYVTLYNEANLSVYDHKGERLFSKNELGRDRLRKTLRESSIIKEAVSTSNDAEKRTYTVGWNVQMKETYTTGKGETSPVDQDGGTFYDLLPYGSHYVKGTVNVRSGKESLSDGDYSVEVIPNYRDGRDLLKVAISKRGVNWSVGYSTVTSWTDIKDGSRKVTNPVVYETGNSNIKGGTKEPSLIPLKSDRNVFIETEASIFNGTFIDTVSGLTKTVRTGDGTDKLSAEVRGGNDYVYVLRYQNSTNSSSKNNVFYDDLENWKNSDWHGTLQYVDVEQLKMAGCDPKVYISYGGDDYVPVDQADLSKAKKVKIDCSKNSSGGDFILPKDKTISIKLVMKAPKMVEGENKKPKTYNGVSLSTDIISPGGTKNFNISQGYTQVTHIVVKDFIRFHKQAADSKESIKGIRFTVQGTSDYGNVVNIEKTTDAKGNFSINDLERGEYALFESYSGEDWILDPTVHKIKVAPDGTAFFDGEEVKGTLILENKRRVHSDVVFRKVDGESPSVPVAQAQFLLSGTSDYGTNVVLKGTSERNGIVRFRDIEKGTYVLREIMANKKYIINREEIKVVVNGEGVVSFKGDTVIHEGDEYDITNSPKMKVFFYKTDSFDGKPVNGSVFTLEGNGIKKSATSSNAGYVEFTGLEPGSYALKETSAPDGYMADPEYKVVNVEEKSFTIEGLKKDFRFGDEDFYRFVNEKKPEGHVYVTKAWDSETVPSEKDLNITISTSPDAWKADCSTLTFFSTTGDFSNGKNTNTVYLGPDMNIVSGEIEVPGQCVLFQPNKDKFGFQSSKLYSPYEIKKVLASGKGAGEKGNLEFIGRLVEEGIYPIRGELMNKKYKNLEFVYTSQLPEEAKILKYPSAANRTVGCAEIGDTLYVVADDGVCVNFNRPTNAVNVKNEGGVLFSNTTTFANCVNMEVAPKVEFIKGKKVSLSRMFLGCKNLKDISALRDWVIPEKADTMGYMFENCSSLEDISPLSAFDTSGITSMTSIFSNCSSLKDVSPLRNWNTKKLKSLNTAFCKSGIEDASPLGSWNTQSLTDLTYAFKESKLKNIEGLENWDVSHVVSIRDTFALTKVDNIEPLRNWDTSSVVTAEGAFSYTPIEDISPITEMKFPNLKTAKDMFRRIKIKSIPMIKWESKDLTNISGMFCTNLGMTDIEGLSGLKVDNVTDVSSFLGDCNSYKSVAPLKDWNVSNIEHADFMFGWNTSVKDWDKISNWKIPKLKTTTSMFGACTFENLDFLSGWGADGIVDANLMFQSCHKLKDVSGISDWGTSNLENISRMFKGDLSLKDVDPLKKWDLSKVKNLEKIFERDPVTDYPSNFVEKANQLKQSLS